MKMLKVHQNAPTSMLKSQNFSGGHTPDPRINSGGEGWGGDGLGWEGRKLVFGPPKNYPVAPPMAYVNHSTAHRAPTVDR
jgi:hypothetical protein